MAAFAAIAFARWHRSGSVFFLLLALRDALTSAFILRRPPPRLKDSARADVLAFASAAFPFLYLPGSGLGDGRISTLVANLLAMVGFLIATLAVIDLGRSFGVSPAVRSPRIETGLYRYVRHPMYCGYVVAETGWILLNPINTPLFAISAGLYWMRARLENRLFERAALAPT